MVPLRFAGRRGVTTDGYRALFRAADDPDLVRGLCGSNCLDHCIGIDHGLAGHLNDEIAFNDAGTSSRTLVLDSAHEETIAFRQAHRAAQPACDTGRSHRHAQAWSLHAFTAGESIDAISQRRIGRQGKVEPLAETVRVQSQETALPIEDGAAGRARREWSGVLDAPGNSATSGPAKWPSATARLRRTTGLSAILTSVS